MSSFQKDLLSGAFYIGIAKYAGIICQVIITAILARILTPDDYGVIAIAMVLIVFLNTLSDVGIGPAIIQRKDLSEKDIDHLFSLNIYVGFFIAVLFFLCSDIISDYYGNPQLKNVCRWLSLLILFTCARTVPMNLLYREKQFKYIAFTNLMVQVICGIVSIFAAMGGWGVYALVLSQVLSAFLLLIVYTFNYRRHFYYKLDLTPFKRIFSYSIYNFAGSIFIYLTLNVDKLIVGKTIGSKGLGYYEKSYSLVFMPINNITFVITPVLHPLLSGFQNNLRELASKFLKVVHGLAFISFPLSVICFFISKELILVFYGNQWYPAIPPFQIMSFAISFLMLDTTVGAIFNAANETKRGFYTMLIMSCVMVISILVAVYVWNTIIAVAYAFLFAKVVGTLINFFSLMQGLEGRFFDFLREIARPFLVGLILFLVLGVFFHFMTIGNVFLSLIVKSALSFLVAIVLIQYVGKFDIIHFFRLKRSHKNVKVNQEGNN